MNIIECFTQGKKNKEQLNEDGYFVSNDFVAVFDGASTFENESFSQYKTTGRIARDSVKNSLNRLTRSDRELSKQEMLDLLTEDLYKELPNDKEYYHKNKHLGLEVSCVIYSDFHKEIWVFGDCHIVINNQDHSLPMSNAHKQVVDARVKLVTDRLLKESYTHVLETDTSFEQIKHLIHKQRQLANQEYVVLTGFPINQSLTKTISVKECDTIILATDGYSVLKETLLETEKELHQLLKIDPLCIKELKGMKPIMAKNKSFDDRTFVKFSV